MPWCPFCFSSPLDEGGGADCFALVVFLVSCGSWCFVGLPRDAVGWSAVGGCGIS